MDPSRGAFTLVCRSVTVAALCLLCCCHKQAVVGTDPVRDAGHNGGRSEAGPDPVCGDGVREGGEGCDSTDFGDWTCQTMDHAGGQLECSLHCTIMDLGCFDCPDRRCEENKGEDYLNCRQDCWSWTDLSAGGMGCAYFNCAVGIDGRAWCWGWNKYGRLGAGTDTGPEMCDFNHPCSRVPIQVAGLSDVRAVSAGYNHTCALINDGTVWCWGLNVISQLAQPAGSHSATPMLAATDAAALSAGFDHTCILKHDGTVWCWGSNEYGQLGQGDNMGPELCYYPDTPCSSTPLQVQGLGQVQALSMGGGHNCVLKDDGTVWCWGSNMSGELGDGTSDDRYTPVQVVSLPTVTQISAGGAHTCAIDIDARAWCWGRNLRGPLGDGTETDRLEPTLVTDLGDAAAISAGLSHTCAIGNDETVWCWGNGDFGQLGQSPFTFLSLVPLQVANLTEVVAVAAGGYNTCVLKSDGSAWCWGSNEMGELGIGDPDSAGSLTPVKVSVPE